MLDSDLAELYDVPAFRLNEAVKRKARRFPADFMFQLTKQERALTSQFAMSKNGRGGRRSAPYAFTEQGVAMLSSVLNSDRAVLVNVAIMRAFVKVREIMATHKDLAHKIEALERKYSDHEVGRGWWVVGKTQSRLPPTTRVARFSYLQPPTTYNLLKWNPPSTLIT